MKKTRKKSGFRRAQRMYHGRAVRQRAAIAAGPFARTARPRKKPKRREVRKVEEVKDEEFGAVAGVPADLVAAASLDESGGKPPHSKGRRSRTATQTIAIVNMALKGMSVAAAWEKPIMPTVVGSRSSSQRAVSAP